MAAESIFESSIEVDRSIQMEVVQAQINDAIQQQQQQQTRFQSGYYDYNIPVNNNNSISNEIINDELNLCYNLDNPQHAYIYDYQNRARENPKNFIVNTNDGLVGLSTAAEIYRTRGLI